MINTHRIGLVVLTVGLVSFSSFADKVGDPAAPLTVKEWIKGGPVEIKPGTNIYVVEFWAALSPSSRECIPKLNEVQKKFKDRGVIVVGIGDDPADKLREFVQLRAKVDYTVAADDQRKTARAYMVAYGQNAIPHVFIVGRDGKVLWHGHPLYKLEEALEEITTGHYDVAAAIKADTARAEVDEYRSLARKGDPQARELGWKLLAARTNDAVKLYEFCYRIVTDLGNTNRDFALAAAALDRAEKLLPTNTAQLIMARGVMLFEKGQKEEGMTLAKQAVALGKEGKEKESLEKYVAVMEGRLEAESKRKRKSRQMPQAPSQKGSTNASGTTP